MSDRDGHRDGGSASGRASGHGSDSTSARGSGFFGASSQRSAYASAAVAALHGTNAASATTSAAGAWHASTTDRRPPREMLYVKKLVALADFKRDVFDGTVAAYGKLPVEEKHTLFGASVVPIFVPLAPGESEAQYDARFADWVQRKHGVSLRELETSADENLERFYRMRFATANARGDETFEAPGEREGNSTSTARREEKNTLARSDDRRDRSRSRSRSRHSDRHRDRHSRSTSQRRRSQSPDRRSRDRHSNSSETTATTRSERDDQDRQRRHASLSPARSAGGARAPMYAWHPSSGQRVPREALYVKKYVDLDQYKYDFSHFKIVSYTKLPEAKLEKLFGSTIIPIHVPLARGETKEQYEERFEKWLKRKGHTRRAVETHDDPAFERVMRIKFANLNAQGKEAFVAPDTKRERTTETETSPRPTKKVAREEDVSTKSSSSATAVSGSRDARSTASMTSSTASSSSSSRGEDSTSALKSSSGSSSNRSEKPSSASGSKSDKPAVASSSSSSRNDIPPAARPSSIMTGADTAARSASSGASRSTTTTPTGTTASRNCTFTKPAEGALTSAIAAAYIACGCRLCLVTGVRFLNGKANELGEKVCTSCSAKPADTETPSSGVVDLTQDDDPQSPRNHSSRFAAAITKLVTSKTAIDELQEELATSSTAAPTAEVVSDDPVEQHLLREYEQINQTVIMHEKKLGDLAARLANTPATDTHETMRLQDKSQALRDVIHEKSNDRSAALAMVIAHMWRHKMRDLESHIGDHQTKNVLHIQRTSHEKCSTLSAAIETQRNTITGIKKRIDTAMASTSTNSKDLIASLGRLGEGLTKAEQQVQKLTCDRRLYFTTLMEYDQSLRVLIKTQLQRSS